MAIEPNGLLLHQLRRWESLKQQREDLDVAIADAAATLEQAAMRIKGPYAQLLGQDTDGRIRFRVRGGESSLSLGELAEVVDG